MAADVEAYAPFRALGAVLEVVRFPYPDPGTAARRQGRAPLDPPYGLRKSLGARLGTPAYPDLDRAWMRDCVHRFCSEVLELPDLTDTAHLTIHEWSTDWSNFFDAGREWWGTFCWTIEDRKRDWTTAILASSTD